MMGFRNNGPRGRSLWVVGPRDRNVWSGGTLGVVRVYVERYRGYAGCVGCVGWRV